VGIVLKNIDCLDLLRSLPDGSIDLMLTDPPYAMTACDWDKPFNLAEMWLEWERVVKPNGAFVFTASQPFTSQLVISREVFFKCEWIWQKNRPSNFGVAKYHPMKEHESIIVFGRGRITYNPILEVRKGSGVDRVKYKINPSTKTDNYGESLQYQTTSREYDEMRLPASIQKFNTETGMHPTQKPVDLFRYLIRTYSNPGETVFDGYSGSGTTAIACIKENRDFVGCELNKEYYDKSMERISIALSKPELFT
jgi:site-specific DNA-methyltransferase (adenine-specific)